MSLFVKGIHTPMVVGNAYLVLERQSVDRYMFYIARNFPFHLPAMLIARSKTYQVVGT
jgi:hypothetical protein